MLQTDAPVFWVTEDGSNGRWQGLPAEGMGLPVEGALPVPPQGPQPDVLLGFVEAFVPIIASAALGGADPDPSGSLANRPGVSGYLYKGFDQHRGDPVAFLPVFGQASFHDRQQMGAEIGDADPGQNEESRIVDHPRQVLLALFVGPADKAVTRRQFPCGGGEAEQGKGIAGRLTAPVVSTDQGGSINIARRGTAGCAHDTEPVVQVVPKRDLRLVAGLRGAETGMTGHTSVFTARPERELAPVQPRAAPAVW